MEREADKRKGGKVVIKGTRRNVSVTVEYSAMKEVFVPDGADAEELIGGAIYEMVNDLPADVDGFGITDFSYKEF